MAKWIEEENGEVWIPTSTAAKMLCISQVGFATMFSLGTLQRVRVVPRIRMHYYLLSEVETLARDPKRLTRSITHEVHQESRILGDPAKVDATFMTAKQAREFLGTSLSLLTIYVNQRHLTSYQKVPGRSPHRFDPYEVRVLRNRRERLARIRVTNREFRENDARQCGKVYVPYKRDLRALSLNSLKPHEQQMDAWITTRQVAALLEVCANTVFRLRTRGRLYGEKRSSETTPRKRKLWFFRKREVLALREDPEYQKGRERFRRYCVPLARRLKAETAFVRHTESSSLDWEALGSQWRVIEGGDW